MVLLFPVKTTLSSVNQKKPDRERDLLNAEFLEKSQVF